MDWANERYVRLYVRDSTTWKLIDWRARCTLAMLLRKVDRAGVLEHGGHGVMGLAAVIELPLEVVEPGVAQLVSPRIAVLVETPTEYVIPNYLEAQEASQTEAHRSREYRGRKRDLAIARGKGLITNDPETVTKRDADATERDDTVTARHRSSPTVTPSLAEPSQEKNSAPPAAGGMAELRTKVDRATGEIGARRAKKADTTPDEQAAAERVLQKLSERNGVRYSASKEHVRLIAAQLRSGVSESDLARVVSYCAVKLEWATKPEMAPYLRPETLFGPKTIARYLDPARTWSAPAPRLRVATPEDDAPQLDHLLRLPLAEAT